MKTKNQLPFRQRAVVFGVFTLFLAMVIALALPQGRVWAQYLIRFFTPGANQVALPTSQPVTLVPLASGTPRPVITPTDTWSPAFAAACGSQLAPRCSIEQIQDMVNFPLKSFAVLPQELHFLGATGGPDSISLLYRRDDPVSNLLLIETPLTLADTPYPVGSGGAVEQVEINDVSGEYVRGTYLSSGGDSLAQWDPNADTRLLRWEEQGIRYTIWMNGSIDFPEFSLDRDGLVRAAASLTAQTTRLSLQPTAETPETVSAVEQKAGFVVVEPTWLPEQYQFDRAVYLSDSKRVCLIYHHPTDVPVFQPSNSPAPTLSIAWSASAPLPDINDLIVSELRPDQILLEQATLTVRGALQDQGQYAYGSLNAGQICGTRSNQNEVLTFQVKGFNVAIVAQAEGPLGADRNWLTRQEMVQVAESITGAPSALEPTQDPEYLTSIAEAEKMAGFPLKVPTRLPEGMRFTFGQVKQLDRETQVTLNFSDGSQTITIRQRKDGADTLETLAQDHPEAHHQITIHNQPALLSQGFWNDGAWKEIANGGDGSASVTWFETGIEYSVSGFNAYPSQVWIDIAESVQ